MYLVDLPSGWMTLIFWDMFLHLAIPQLQILHAGSETLIIKWYFEQIIVMFALWLLFLHK